MNKKIIIALAICVNSNIIFSQNPNSDKKPAELTKNNHVTQKRTDTQKCKEESAKANTQEAENINKLMKLMFNPETMLNSIKANLAVMVNHNPSLKDDKSKTELIEKMSNDLANALTSDDMKNKMSAIYKKYFTAKDISDLLKFYESPVGSKTLSTLPQLSADVMQITMEITQNIIKKNFEQPEKAKPTATTESK